MSGNTSKAAAMKEQRQLISDARAAWGDDKRAAARLGVALPTWYGYARANNTRDMPEYIRASIRAHLQIDGAPIA